MAVTFLPRKRQDLHVRLPEMEDLKQEVSCHSCQGCGPSAVTDWGEKPRGGTLGVWIVTAAWSTVRGR